MVINLAWPALVSWENPVVPGSTIRAQLYYALASEIVYVRGLIVNSG